jgi:hypothetical protein
MKKTLMATMMALVMGSAHAGWFSSDDAMSDQDKADYRTTVKTWFSGEQTLMPARKLASKVIDDSCSKQWNLPVKVASSGIPRRSDDKKSVWENDFGVSKPGSKSLTVIAALPETGLVPGDVIIKNEGDAAAEEGYRRLGMSWIRDNDDKQEPFEVVTDKGKRAKIEPFQTCKGWSMVEILDNKLNTTQYASDWVIQPVETFAVDLSPAEAEWIVLWSEGFSAEATTRLQMFKLGKFAVGVAMSNTVSSAASGTINSATSAVKNVAQDAAKEAASAASKAAAQEIARQAMAQAKGMIQDAVTKVVATRVAGIVAKKAVGYAYDPMWNAVAETAFDDADAWAFKKMKALGMDPKAALTLSAKLSEAGVKTHFVMDENRLAAFGKLLNGDDVSAPDVARVVPADVMKTVSVSPEQNSIEFTKQ